MTLEQWQRAIVISFCKSPLTARQFIATNARLFESMKGMKK